jgi:adenine phosphoribosyltransferase
MLPSLETRIRQAVREVPDFPSPGIRFKDITPMLADPHLMVDAVRAMAAPFAMAGITHVVAVESRGFLFGIPVAMHLGARFAPARKPGKLPWKTARESYALEYGEDALELHTDAVTPSGRVLIVDDVLATGGTAEAVCRLVERIGGTVAGMSFLTELVGLGGRARLAGREICALVRY